MTNTLLTLLCVVAIAVAVSSAVTVYFVVKLAGSVARMNASNNVYEYMQMERGAKIGSKAVREQVEEDLEKERANSGQTQTDGTLSDGTLQVLSKII